MDVIVLAAVLGNALMLVRHEGPHIVLLRLHSATPMIPRADISSAAGRVLLTPRASSMSRSSIEINSISLPVTTLGVGWPQSGQRKLYRARGALICWQAVRSTRRGPSLIARAG